MAKTYQSDKPGYSLAIDNNNCPWNPNEDGTGVIVGAGVLGFTPETEPLTGIVFGELNSNNPLFLKRIQISTAVNPLTGAVTSQRDATPAEIEKIVENSKAFKNCKTYSLVGVRGIWDKTERLKKLQSEVGVAQATAEQALDKLDEGTLRLILQSKGISYSAESPKAELVKLAAAAQGAPARQGPQTTAPPTGGKGAES